MVNSSVMRKRGWPSGKSSSVTSFTTAVLMSSGSRSADDAARVAALAQRGAEPPAGVHRPLLVTVVARHSGTSPRTAPRAERPAVLRAAEDRRHGAAPSALRDVDRLLVAGEAGGGAVLGADLHAGDGAARGARLAGLPHALVASGADGPVPTRAHVHERHGAAASARLGGFVETRVTRLAVRPSALVAKRDWVLAPAPGAGRYMEAGGVALRARTELAVRAVRDDVNPRAEDAWPARAEIALVTAGAHVAAEARMEKDVLPLVADRAGAEVGRGRHVSTRESTRARCLVARSSPAQPPGRSLPLDAPSTSRGDLG
jgi:hypothetical protein